VLVIGDREVHQATLAPGVRAGDPTVRELLVRWPGQRFVQHGGEGTALLLVRALQPPRAERTWLHAFLFLLTLATTTLAGGFLHPADPLRLRMAFPGGVPLPLPSDLSAGALAAGLWFSLPLVAILGAHELGHYAAARRRGMDVSPPFFVPAPYLVSLIGTFGAFIRIRSPLLTRGTLLEMAAAGPLASFVLSIPAMAAGLALSAPRAAGGGTGMYLGIGGVPDLELGTSLMVGGLRALVPGAGEALVLHPLAVAGWVGFFFTVLNLFPVSQLDGGHVAFALSARAHRWVGFATVGLLLAMGTRSETWLVWAVVVLLLGRGRLGHPPVVDARFRLGPARTAVAWACMAVFVLTLVPVPIR
jgi:membrane-associated protease RseP (regulator of RpoE activity)